MKKRAFRILSSLLFLLILTTVLEIGGFTTLRVEAAKKNGFVTINGDTYYYRNGKKVKGLQEIKKKYYYFDTKTRIMQKDTTVEVKGKTYYFHKEDGHAITGVARVKISKKNQYVFFDPSTKTGYAKRGLATDPETKKIYYVSSNKGIVETDTSKVIAGKGYYFDKKDGHAISGFVKFKKSNGSYYGRYYDLSSATGYAAKGVVKDSNGDMYLVGDKGIVKTGLQRVSSKKLYLIDKSTMKILTGWQRYKGYIYYFKPKTGLAVSGVTTIKGKRYVFSDKNILKVNGQIEIDGKVYYCDENGEIVDGIVKRKDEKGKVYYKYYDSSTSTGYPDLGGKSIGIVDGKYCVDKKGILHLRVQCIKGKYYYFDEKTLEMQTGVYPMGDKGYLYYFDPKEKSGIVNSEGIAKKNGKLYYFIPTSKNYSYIYEGLKYVYEDNAKQAGLDGVYYFDRSTGAAIKNTSKTIGAVKYSFGSDGKATWTVNNTKYPNVAKMFKFGLSCLGKEYGEIRPDTKQQAEKMLLKMDTYTCCNFVAACYKAGFDSFDMYEGYSRVDFKTKKYGLYSDEQAIKCAKDGTLFYNPDKLKVGDFAFFNDENCDNLAETGSCDRIYNINQRRMHVHHVAIYMGNDGESYYFLETTHSANTVRIRSLTKERLICSSTGTENDEELTNETGDSYYISAYGRLN
ncbi:MAG: hypothetical protein NC081_01500 [Roseburia sp.]|nr:hypothetical protein [Roseburia sp.]